MHTLKAEITPILHELRFILCGSAGDGRSALIDRLTDRREQGGSDDAMYRLVVTERGKRIVAASTGNEQCPHNIVSHASNADAAIVMVDARKGVVTQTLRDSYLLSLAGIRHFVLAVNRMDQVAYSENACQAIVDEYFGFAKLIGVADVRFIPISAVEGDNIVVTSENMPWYRGATLMDWLENVEVDPDRLRKAAFRFLVQSVNQPNQDFRGFAGGISSGVIKLGERIRVQPSGREGRVARIITADGDLELASAGQSVTLAMAAEIDISLGDVISSIDSPASVADQFEATLVWLADEPMLPGRRYLLKIGANAVNAEIGHLKYKLNVSTLARLAATKLETDEIGVCNISLERQIAFDPYRENRDTGGFILVDRVSHATVGAGMLGFALRRASNVHIQAVDIDKSMRAAIKHQRPCILWLTGLSGSGKSTIANCLEKLLHSFGRHSYLLDGDNLRHGLNKDLGFTDADRVENIRRVGEVARLMVDAGLIVITAFISPFSAERRMARSLVKEGEFFEIFVDVPLAVAEARDPKGLYKKARRGELKNFTGIDSAYEAPEAPEIRIDTTVLEPQQAARMIVDKLIESGIIEVGLVGS
jgi:bifunctional enzyme CysN/CysC